MLRVSEENNERDAFLWTRSFLPGRELEFPRMTEGGLRGQGETTADWRFPKSLPGCGAP